MPLRLVLATLWAAAVATGAGAQGVGSRADSILRAAESRGFSGVVRVDTGGETVLRKGYGLANRESRIAFTPGTVVEIGSATKDFTVVSILQLHERGRLNLRDSIGKFFAGAPADKRAITITQLITHRAGFPLRLGSPFDTLTRRGLVDSAMRTVLLFPSGSRESYSNVGYGLLAAIIEQVSGMSYDAYVNENVLRPLGLAHTGLLLPSFDPRTVARQYEPDGTDAGTVLTKPHADDGPYWNLRGSGGMLSTVDDMHAFYHTLFATEKLLKPETRRLRFNPDEATRAGGMDGPSFFLYQRDPRTGSEIIVASTSPSAPTISRELGRLLGLPDAIGQSRSR